MNAGSMAQTRPSWRERAFSWAAIACALFFVMTLAAMLTYPGGTYVDAATRGFSFWNNFFSDLGRTETRLGAPQTLSYALFTAALPIAASGLMAFFIAFAGLVCHDRPARLLSGAGSLFGCLAGLLFVGIALVPANVDLALHDRLVQWAFRAFLVAVLCYIAALARQPGLPRHFARVFGGFVLLLAAYVLLITFGPSPRAPAGQTIQATAQKIIVYASILCVALQSLRARRLLSGRRS